MRKLNEETVKACSRLPAAVLSVCDVTVLKLSQTLLVHAAPPAKSVQDAGLSTTPSPPELRSMRVKPMLSSATALTMRMHPVQFFSAKTDTKHRLAHPTSRPERGVQRSERERRLKPAAELPGHVTPTIN